MFFYLAKVLWFLLQPSTLIALLIAYGSILIWTGWARWGRRFVSVGAILLLIAGLSPLGNALILPLEDRFPRTNLDQPPPPTGFIVLGGAEDRLVGTARKAPTLNEAGERIVETVMLARKFPEAKIAFSGGDAGILYSSDTEAIGAQRLLTDMGVAPDRLILECGARDTYENAVYLKAELGKLGLLGPGKRWVLITSAYHMPRAMASFRQAGFDVEPWPVDYRTRGARRSHAALRQGLGRIAAGRCCHAGMGRALRLLARWAERLRYSPRRRWLPWAAISLRRKPAVRQAPHVDPILEIGRGAEVGTLFAAIGRNHLAQHAEAGARTASSHIMASSGLRVRKRAVMSCRQTRIACGSGKRRAGGGAVSSRNADQMSAALVVKVRRCAVGCGVKTSFVQSSGAISASLASFSGSASGPSKASASAFSRLAISASSGCLAKPASLVRNCGTWRPKSRALFRSDGWAAT